MRIILSVALTACMTVTAFCQSESNISEEHPDALIQSFSNHIVSSPPDSMDFDPFYKKYTDAFGIPVISSEIVPDDALLVARDIINYMLAKRPDIRASLVKRGARLLIMADTEFETDLPERSHWKKPAKDDGRLTPYERENYDKPGGIGSMTDKEYWNQRARGMGGTVTSCAEENILGYPGTKYYGENILVHEFSHNMMGALREADPELFAQIQPAYEAAKAKDMYKNQYAINTVAEYWAEGTQWWFWSNYGYYGEDATLESPMDLKAYDPTLYNILDQVYAGHHIPSDVYHAQNIKHK